MKKQAANTGLIVGIRMKPFSEQTGRDKRVEVARWLAVLPAAWLSRIIVLMVAGRLYPLTSAVPVLARLIKEAPVAAAIVIVGARVAPRFQSSTAFALAILWTILSVTIHLILPTRLGQANWLDAIFAAMGAVAAAAFVRSRKSTKPQADV